MAANAVTGDQYRAIDRKLREITRQLDQDGGYPFDLGKLDKHLQAAIEGKFSTRSKAGGELCSLEQAAEIFGGDFHSLEEAQDVFGLPVSNDQAAYQNLACPLDAVMAYKDTHVLVPLLPLNLAATHAALPSEFWPGQRQEPWFGERRQGFAREVAELLGYYFVRKDEVPGSTSQTRDYQFGMVKAPEFVPSTVLAAQAALLHHSLNGEKLFSKVWVRTADRSAEGRALYVGFFAVGFLVGYWSGYASSDVGVASARKFG